MTLHPKSSGEAPPKQTKSCLENLSNWQERGFPHIPDIPSQLNIKSLLYNVVKWLLITIDKFHFFNYWFKFEGPPTGPIIESNSVGEGTLRVGLLLVLPQGSLHLLGLSFILVIQ